jgi:tetratricopeptide (TPR) repeat protein
MRILCLNNEKDDEKIRQTQVEELYQKYAPEKLRFFANYDLLYNKRYRAGAAIFERYLKVNRADVSTELNLATCYVEIGNYDEAEALLTKIMARPAADKNAATEFGRSVVSDIRARIYIGRRQYDKAQESFQELLKTNWNDPYYTLAVLYCAAQRDVSGEKAGEFDVAYRIMSVRSEIVVEVMGYHIDALRAFVLVKQGRTSLARKIVEKWVDSADAKKYVPIFWRRFPEGGQIIDTWQALMPQQSIAAAR